MVLFSSTSIKAQVQLIAPTAAGESTSTPPTYYPGQQVEGVVTLEVQHPFLAKNIHLKLVGREQVHAMVDQVKQSRTAELQYGITSQDYVYYRDIVTFVGDLLTRRRKPSTLSHPLPVQPSGNDRSANSSFGVAPYDDRSMVGEFNLNNNSGPLGWDQGEDFKRRNQGDSSSSDQPVEPQRDLSFGALEASEAAAARGGYVIYPEGTYTYPFCVTLPEELPPSYETGVCVKDSQFSNSQSTLTYYAKVYVQYYKKGQHVVPEGEKSEQKHTVKPSDYETASSDAAVFRVLPMQPIASNLTFMGCDCIHLREEKRVVECPFPLKKGFHFSSLFGGGKSKKKKKSQERKPKDLDEHHEHHHHHADDDTSTAAKEDDGDKLTVRIGLSENHYQIAKDKIEVKCALHNTTKKEVEGFKVSLIQQLTFHTVKAEVKMTNVLLEYKFNEHGTHTFKPDEKKTVVLTTEVLPASKINAPTLSTTGLHVHYDVRVEVLHSELRVNNYDFVGVVLTGVAEQRDVSEIPVGEMTFVALTPGALTRPEAFYVVPDRPCAAAKLPQLDTLNVRGSEQPSRAPTPRN